MQRHPELETLVQPVLERLGYRFFGLEYLEERRVLLRVYIEKPGLSVSTEDCERASRALSAALDVSSRFQDRFYTLEVSSPGLDCILFTVSQMQDRVGALIQVHLKVPLEGRRRLKGRLESVRVDEQDQPKLIVTVPEKPGDFWCVEMRQVERVRVVPEWPRPAGCNPSKGVCL